MKDSGADPALAKAEPVARLGPSGFDPGEEPLCGPNFEPENGCRECRYCGRMLFAECTAWKDAAA